MRNVPTKSNDNHNWSFQSFHDSYHNNPYLALHSTKQAKFDFEQTDKDFSFEKYESGQEKGLNDYVNTHLSIPQQTPLHLRTKRLGNNPMPNSRRDLSDNADLEHYSNIQLSRNEQRFFKKIITDTAKVIKSLISPNKDVSFPHLVVINALKKMPFLLAIKTFPI